MRQLKRMNRRPIATMMKRPKERPDSGKKASWYEAFRPSLEAGKSILDNKAFMHTTAQKQKLELAVQASLDSIRQIEDNNNAELPDEKQEVQTGVDMHGNAVMGVVGVEEHLHLLLEKKRSIADEQIYTLETLEEWLTDMAVEADETDLYKGSFTGLAKELGLLVCVAG